MRAANALKSSNTQVFIALKSSNTQVYSLSLNLAIVLKTNFGEMVGIRLVLIAVVNI